MEAQARTQFQVQLKADSQLRTNGGGQTDSSTSANFEASQSSNVSENSADSQQQGRLTIRSGTRLNFQTDDKSHRETAESTALAAQSRSISGVLVPPAPTPRPEASTTQRSKFQGRLESVDESRERDVKARARSRNEASVEETSRQGARIKAAAQSKSTARVQAGG